MKTNGNLDIYCGPEYLFDYFVSLVNIVDNPIGVYVREKVLNRLKVALPGEAVMTAWCDYGSFKSLFYPDASTLPDQDILDTLAEVSGYEWGLNCVPFVCDAIYMYTSRMKYHVNIAEVRACEKSIPDLMGYKHTAYYRYLLQNYSDTKHFNPTKEAYTKLTADQKTHAKADYIRAITADSWVSNKIIAYKTGEWKNPDWELYHHWNKLMILGASEAEVNGIINQLASKGLPVFDTVNSQNWLKYSRWASMVKQLSVEDFQEAAGAMNVGTTVGTTWCAEVYSSLFMSKGNPGESYWQMAPDTSCFSENTLVRMADGSLCKISDVKCGDAIDTPRGAKKVMLISTPLRAKRTLYSYGGHSFQFSGTPPI